MQETSIQHKNKRDPKKLLFGVLIILFGAFAVYQGISGLTDNKSQLIAPSGVIQIEIADSPESRSTGLSGRESIDDNFGMMFVFDNPSVNNCFWMKDMNFSIDMVWLDSDKKVVTVVEDVSPDSYPDSYCPETDALYGLEVGVNRAQELGISPGEKLRF